jgi:hypothetical protein
MLNIITRSASCCFAVLWTRGHERSTGDPALAGQVVPGVQGGDESGQEGKKGALAEGGGGGGEGVTYRWHIPMGTKAVILFSASFGLVLAAFKPLQDFPKFRVDRRTMTVTAKRDRLHDVSLFKWADALPDTITDTLRFFARNATEFVNENELNRMKCVRIEDQLIEQRGESVDPEQLELWRDSLEQIYREMSYTKLDLLADSAMLFDSSSANAFTLQPLAALMERGHWYLFALWEEGGSHMPYRCWWVSFYLNKDGLVEHWVNCRRTYPAYGGSVKNL